MIAPVLFAVQGADDIQSNAVSQLLLDIPSQSNLEHYQSLVVPCRGTFVMNESAKAKELEHAMAEVERAKVNLPKLRKLLRPGTSVFEYPGLLAHGKISYNEYSKTYNCYIGLYLLPHEGVEPYDFYLTFDSRGQITAVENAVHKR